MLTNWHGGRLQRMAVRDGFLGRILHHAQTDVVVELIHGHCVVVDLARNAALEDSDRLRGLRSDLFGHQQAGPTATDDCHVNRF